MKPQAILGDERAYGRAWSATDFADRRRITRAINRGEVLEDGNEAQLAVMTARRQITFWRWGWLIGPVVTLFQVGTELTVFLVSMAMTTAVTVAVSRFFLARARRAEALNLDLAERTAARARKKGGGGKGARPHPKSQQAQDLASARAANRPWWRRLTSR